MDARTMDISKKRQRAGRLGGRKRSERKTAANQNNGRLGGRARSEGQAAAARSNGKLGGRPKNAIAEEQALDSIFGVGSISM
jgi:hypothetical protein